VRREGSQECSDETLQVRPRRQGKEDNTKKLEQRSRSKAETGAGATEIEPKSATQREFSVNKRPPQAVFAVILEIQLFSAATKASVSYLKCI
jgi:hypothetical protein